MSPLCLVNWHRVNTRFRALMWMIAIVLALVILIGTARGSHSGHAAGVHKMNPHVVAGTLAPGQ
jgi:hypothetical protein